MQGGGKDVLEERDSQVTPQPRAASRSAPAFSFARGVSAFLCETGPWRQTLHYSSLLFGEEGVDRSNYSLVSHWFNRPGGKKFDAGVVVRNNIVF